MRTLKELGALVAEDATQRYFFKRANMLAPMALGMGLQAPGIAHDIKKRYQDTKRQLALAASSNLGERIASEKIAVTPYAPSRKPDLSNRQVINAIKRTVNESRPSGPSNRAILNAIKDKTPPSSGMHDFLADTAKKTVSSLAVDAIKGGVGVAWNMFTHRNDDQARDVILADLKKNDPIISQADDKILKEAFGSMVRFAPTLSTDKNAVRSYLREAVMSGAGPNYSTIKSLADAENAVTGRGRHP